MAKVDISEETLNLLNILAAESETDFMQFLDELVVNKDKRRHIENQPYIGEVRIRCFRAGCKEKNLSSSVVDSNEIVDS